jgi:hypothetical protein
VRGFLIKIIISNVKKMGTGSFVEIIYFFLLNTEILRNEHEIIFSTTPNPSFTRSSPILFKEGG